MLAAVERNDTPKDAESMAAKVLKMKMWPDDSGGPVRDPALFRDSPTFLMVLVET